jgi:hypothetical protein
MRRKRLIVVAGTITGLLVVVVWLLLQHSGLCPVEVRFVGNMECTNSRTGMTFTGPTFSISNRTDKVLHVSPWAVEVKDGANWMKLDYRDSNGGVLLGPGVVATQTLDFSSQLYSPPTSTWRLEINVAERLSSAGAFVAAVKHYPGWWLQRRRAGKSTLSIANPLANLGATWYGHPRKVLSEEVGERRSSS